MQGILLIMDPPVQLYCIPTLILNIILCGAVQCGAVECTALQNSAVPLSMERLRSNNLFDISFKLLFSFSKLPGNNKTALLDI